MLKKEKYKDVHEFHPLNIEIEERPINPLAHYIFGLIIFIIVFGLLWLFFAKIDIVVSARGKVIPTGEIKILQPIETGVISKIYIKEADYVKKGQILMQIDPSVSQTTLDIKEKNLKILNFQIKRISAILENRPLFLDSILKEAKEQEQLYKIQKNFFSENIDKYDTKLSQAKSQYKTSLIEKNRLEIVLSKDILRAQKLEKVIDIIARKEYEELDKNILSLKEQIKITTYKIKETNKRIEEIKQEKNSFISQFKDTKYQELLNIKKEARDLSSQINAIKFQTQKQTIVSPTNGYILKLMTNTIGGVVTPAEKLISVVPEESPLIIKVNVLNQDIGFIKKGMNSKIKIDTFSFQKYGFLNGKIITIGNSSIDDEKLGAVYEVKIQPDGKKLLVEGKERYLEAGMSVTAEIKVGKRRVIEFFIYPIIKYLDEGLSVR
ncbi:secretion protein HylD [Malaciobacter mytili]|uniref:HlyD family type I secretion periplasmic adaptor subunit n=1 Tax=Malaciobacter mytili TaxID=603050 RepID=UPI00100A370D|nr:HlyD family type I secretion periplasmic adaptor subunit [Malaciobacter mytili]RXI36663.1 secretion protein HylD [Malaciobacter mytili]